MPFTDDLVTRIRLDTGQYDDAQRRVVAGTRQIGQEGARASAVAGPPLRQMSAGYRGAGAAALAASNAIGMFAGTQNRAVMAMQMVNIQAATMADALARTGGAVGGFGAALSRALPILAVIGGAITLGVAAWEALTNAKKKNREEIDKTTTAKETLIDVIGRESAAADLAAQKEKERVIIRAKALELIERGVNPIEAYTQAEEALTVVAELQSVAYAKRGLVLQRAAELEAQGISPLIALKRAEEDLGVVVVSVNEEIEERAKASAAARKDRQTVEDAAHRENLKFATDRIHALAAIGDAEITASHAAFAHARAMAEERDEADLLIDSVRAAARELARPRPLPLPVVLGKEALPSPFEEPFDAGADAAARFRTALAETNITLDEFAMRMAAGQATGADFANFMSTTFATAVGAGAGAAMDVMIGKSVQLIRLDKEGKRIADESALSRGEAFQAAAREAVKAVAIEATVRAAFEVAMAAASFAMFNVPGGMLHLKAAASFAIAAGLAGTVAASIPAVTKTTRDRGSGGGADTTLDRFGRPGFGGERGGGDSIVINVRVEPGASPEDTGEAVVRSIRAYERDRGRRVIGA